MFDDELAEDYSVNRYFGLYVDDVWIQALAKFHSLTTVLLNLRAWIRILDGDPTFAIPESNLINNSAVLAYARIRNQVL